MSNIPSESQKTGAINFPADLDTLNFFGGGAPFYAIAWTLV
jgi:hypothetical protein